VDSAIDIHHKDAFQVIRRAWILEWGELESLRRARDAEAVKAFITSRFDTYRPSHEPRVIDVPRSCVIVGTTNHDEFLTDETGSRRFWPLRVGRIELELLEQQRDQLWAEALTLFRRGEPWWLNEEASAQLEAASALHRVRDAWEALVLPWAEKQ